MRAIEKENKRLKDILGRTYEYCLSMFAEHEGQRGLGDMKLPGCSGHVFLSRHSKEISEGTYLHLENMGIFTAAGSENKSEEMLTRLNAAGAALTDPDDHNVARLVITAGDVTVKAKLKQRCILIRVDRKGIGLLSLISGSMPFSIYGCISFRWPGPWNRGSTSAVW